MTTPPETDAVRTALPKLVATSNNAIIVDKVTEHGFVRLISNRHNCPETFAQDVMDALANWPATKDVDALVTPGEYTENGCTCTIIYTPPLH